mmetsp:Transcript_16014/g.30763  ORF Transcript_16014/g.30763 Transcript_16014/m.30763 type:complete len:574 (+) Transcript_16014:1-1722(+)
MHRRQIRRLRRALAAEAANEIANNPLLLEKVMGELPSWVVYPDFERVRWLNKALEEIFPYLQRGITKKVVAVVDPILDRVKPRLLGSLRIMEFTLGDKPPTIAGVKVIDTDKHEVILDLTLRWNSDVKFKLEATPLGSLVSSSVGISGVQIYGEARVTLCPLLPVIPGFAAVTIAFLKKPLVDCKLEGMGKALSVIPGMEDFILSLVSRVINRTLVLPHKKTFKFMEGEYDELIPKPTGMLRVKLLKVTDLPQVNLVNSNMLSFVPGMSTDPRTDLDIAGFNLDQSFQTKAAYATLEPEYNETAHFVLENLGSQTVKIQVWDVDDATQGMTDSRISFGELKLSDMLTGKMKDYQTAEATLGLKKNSGIKSSGGKVHLELSYFPLFNSYSEGNDGAVAGDEDTGSLTKRSNRRQSIETVPSTQCPSPRLLNVGALLHIKVEKATELCSVSSYDGSVDPFVVVTLSTSVSEEVLQTAKTQIKYNTQNPVWDETFYFILQDYQQLKTAQLIFQVFDGTSGGLGMIDQFASVESLLGNTAINMLTLMNNRQMKSFHDLKDIETGNLFLDISLSYFNH